MTKKMGWTEQQENSIKEGLLAGKTRKQLREELGMTIHVMYNCVTSLRNRNLLPPVPDKSEKSRLFEAIRDRVRQGHTREQIEKELGAGDYDFKKAVGIQKLVPTKDTVKRKCFHCKKYFLVERSSGSWHCSTVCRYSNFHSESSDGIGFDYVNSGTWRQAKS